MGVFDLSPPPLLIICCAPALPGPGPGSRWLRFPGGWVVGWLAGHGSPAGGAGSRAHRLPGSSAAGRQQAPAAAGRQQAHAPRTSRPGHGSPPRYDLAGPGFHPTTHALPSRAPTGTQPNMPENLQQLQ